MTGMGSLALALAELAGEDPAKLSNVELTGELRGLLVAVNQLHAQVARRLSVFDRAGLSVDDGCRSSAAWLRAFGRMSGPTAAGWVRRARLCTQLPALAEVAASGEVSAEHVDRVVRLTARVGPEPVAQVEPVLAQAATQLDPAQFGRVCDRVRAHVDPDGADPDARRDFARRGLTLAPLDGMLLVRGQLDPEGGAALSVALDALMLPPDSDELRTPAQRRADALMELARGALRGGQLPTVGGMRPQVGVLLPPAALLPQPKPDRRPAWLRPDPTTGPQPRTDPTAADSDAAGANSDAAGANGDAAGANSDAAGANGDAAGANGDAVAGHATPADSHAPVAANDRRARAGHVASADNPWQAEPAAANPTPAAEPAAVPHPPAWLDWIGDIPDPVAQRLACDADIWRIILDPATGQPLDVGRSHRLVPPWIRKALIARDRGCRFPGCHAPPAWTDAHHLQSWATGGPTTLTNMILLCRFHHSLIHEGGWHIHYHPHHNTITATRPNGNPYDIRGRPATMDSVA
jgi:hypothetical protein